MREVGERKPIERFELRLPADAFCVSAERRGCRENDEGLFLGSPKDARQASPLTPPGKVI